MIANFNLWGGILIYFLLVLILVYLLFRFYRFLFRSKYVFGDRLETRIVSLALTSLFFKEGVILLFITPLRILFSSIIEFYLSVSQFLQTTTSGSQDMSLGFKDRMAALLTNVYSSVQYFNITAVFLAIAFWSLCGQMINSYVNADKTKEPTSQMLPNNMRQNLILGLLFLLSIYLSFASIITVPYFTESDKIEVSKDVLKAKLDATRETFKNSSFSIETQSPVNTIDSAFPAKIKNIENDNIYRNISTLYNNIIESYNFNISTRQKANSLLQQVNQSISKDLNDLYSDLQNKYQVEELNLKSKQKLTYINALADYYSDRVKLGIDRANDILKIVESGDNLINLAMRNFSLDFNTLLNNAAIADTSAQMSQNFHIDYSLRLSMRNYYDELNYLDVNSTLKYLLEAPQPPTAGDELGIFKNISQWLIKPHSMSLVLITGMLGFGLFGAAISTFVRESRKAKGFSTIIITDITGIIIKGVSAAIVIFLGVKGGLAVFSSGDAEPNPYALFFTCLVGAVYSEKIWKWAQEKLLQNFTDDQSEGEKTSINQTDNKDTGLNTDSKKE